LVFRKKNPIIDFILGVAHDAVSLSLSNFLATRLEDVYDKFLGEKEEEEEEEADGK
jgi:hypothetical protein